jgi:hypothetical protein
MPDAEPIVRFRVFSIITKITDRPVEVVPAGMISDKAPIAVAFVAEGRAP